MSSFMCFAHRPLIGAIQVCRKGFSLAFSTDWGGAVASMMWSVIVAHFCWEGAKFRYVFNQMISIASFLALMSRTFSPPLWMGRHRVAMAIWGLIPWFHRNLLIIFVSASLMCEGIPWAFARNCVWPPMIACMMTCFPLRVRCTLSHRSSFVLIVSSTGSQGVRSRVSLPIHAPRILMASPSQAILISGGKGLSSCVLIFLVSVTRFLWDFFPIGMILVFSMLNLAPDPLHQLSRILCTWSRRSSLFRKRLVSSANRVILIALSIPGIMIPLMFGSACIQQAKGSIARSKSGQESGSPCQTPCQTLKVSLRTPFIATLVWALLYSAWTVFMKG